MTTAQATFGGSHVVVTVPLGVLQAGGLGFSPSLPLAKTNALAALQMGALERVVLNFPSQFWTAGPLVMGYISNTQGEYPFMYDFTSTVGSPTLVVEVAGQF